MAISPELKNLINPALISGEEKRQIVPVSFAHSRLFNLVVEKHPRNINKQNELMAKYSPLAEWLAKPRSIDDFITMRNQILYLSWNNKDWPLEYEVGESLKVFRENSSGVKRPYVNKDYYKWRKSVGWLLSLAADLRILDWERVKELKDDPRNVGIGHSATLHRKVELESHFEPNAYKNEFLNSHLHYLSHRLDIMRSTSYGGISRVGLIFGDFRVGDHIAHRKFIEKARKAVGSHGWLQVVTPSNETILKVNGKVDSWDNDERVDRLMSNRNIDGVYCARMPEEFYKTPDLYWRSIWTAIQPDLIFLGEKNHPLQETYQLQARYLGGILLIDDAQVTRRSGDLLGIK